MPRIYCISVYVLYGFTLCFIHKKSKKKMCLLENRFFALTEVISLVLGVHDVAQQNIPTLKNVSRFQTTELGCSAVVERVI